MIKTLSSYYLSVPLVSPLTSLTCTSFKLKIYIWNGDKTTPPVDATLEFTEQNPEALTSNYSVNISKYINDYIEFNPQVITTNYQDGNNQVWFKKEVYYTTENSEELNTPQEIETLLCTKGYGYAMEGVNAQIPSDKILLTNREFKVSRDSKFIVPILIDETPITAPSLEILSITLVSGNNYDITFTTTGTFTGLDLYVDSILGLIIVSSFGTTSPENFDFSEGAGDYDFYLGGLDTATNTYVYSPAFFKTIS